MYDGERASSNDLLLCHYKNLGPAYRLEKHRRLRLRLGAEFEQHGFGVHYTLSDEAQEREFRALCDQATQVLP
jgi:hypothetical protein